MSPTSNLISSVQENTGQENTGQEKAGANDPVSTEIRLSEVISAMSYALDVTEGQREGTPFGAASSE